jgi:hypothetical protein
LYSRSISTDTPFLGASPYGLDPIPRLDPDCLVPEIIGTAAMATAMMHGAGTPALAEMIGRLDHDPVAALFDTATALQLAFRPEQSAELQQLALNSSTLYRVRSGNPGAIRLLAICTPGNLMANTPLDFITSHLDVRLDLLFVVPGQPLPATVPDHDMAFFASGETDATALARLRGLFANWPRPCLNDPSLLPALARNRLSALLSGVPSLCSPTTVRASRLRLDLLVNAGGGLGALLPGSTYPMLVRPTGSHAGIGLAKIDDPAALADYLQQATAAEFYVSAFVDYRSPDGLFRKYRIAFVDRQPYLCHMAVSQNWMVHYLNAGMADDQTKRDDEARAMDRFATGFATRHADAFARLHELLPFDTYSIDCGETSDGRLLVFEADTAAIIHLMDDIETYPYKHVHMRAVFAAFGTMLQRRLGAAAA